MSLEISMLSSSEHVVSRIEMFGRHIAQRHHEEFAATHLRGVAGVYFYCEGDPQA